MSFIGIGTQSGTKMSVTKFSSNANLGELPLYLYRSAPKPVTVKSLHIPCRKNCDRRLSKQESLSESELACQKPRESHIYSLMYDPRIRRGRYMMETGPANGLSGNPSFEMVKKDPLCNLFQKRLQNQKLLQNKTSRSPKPMAVKSRSNGMTTKSPQIESLPEGIFNVLCQTDPYAEIMGIDDVKIEQMCQTDPLVDSDARKSGTMKQKTIKVGDDKETQISPGELWNFDEAIAPIVENFGGAVLEQAFIEIMHEEELDKLRDQQKAFEVVKDTELERLRRLQERQQQIVEDNAKEIHERQKNVEQAIAVGGQISVAMFAKNYLSAVLTTTMEAARKEGVLKDLKAGEPDETIVSMKEWMDTETNQMVSQNFMSRAILDDVIRNSVVETDGPVKEEPIYDEANNVGSENGDENEDPDDEGDEGNDYDNEEETQDLEDTNLEDQDSGEIEYGNDTEVDNE